MAYERIKEIATNVYADLETKAIFDLILPARKLVLDNVEYLCLSGERKRGSDRGYYTCQYDQDVHLCAKNTLEEVFSMFYMSDLWAMHKELVCGDESDCVIHLKSELNACILKIMLTNHQFADKTQYLIDSFVYENSNGENIRIMEDGNNPVFMELKGFGNGTEIIMTSGKDVAERLIDEAKTMIERLASHFNDTPVPETHSVVNGDALATFDKINMPIEELNLSWLPFRYLTYHGVRDVAGLIRCYEAGLLLQMRKFGEKSLLEVESKLFALGIAKTLQLPKARGFCHASYEKIQALAQGNEPINS